jgi:hypothetical protein
MMDQGHDLSRADDASRRRMINLRCKLAVNLSCSHDLIYYQEFSPDSRGHEPLSSLPALRPASLISGQLNVTLMR